MKDIKIQFGKNVKAFRQKAGLSQETLADISLLHRTYIGSVERGERNISLENIVLIAHSLGVLPTDLLEGIE